MRIKNLSKKALDKTNVLPRQKTFKNILPGLEAEMVENHCSKAVFLNRQDASRYREFETILF